MPDPNDETPHTEMVDEAVEVECEKDHVEDIDSDAKVFLTTFETVRAKLEDLARAESDIKRFELSIEADRKRLQKQLESAKIGLRNARVQMGAELAKLDTVGFSNAAKLIKEAQGVG